MSIPLRGLALAALGLSCSGSPGSHGAATATAPSSGGQSGPTENLSSCPQHYGDPGPSCEGEATASNCSYPEGQCYCGQEPRCSGVEAPPEPDRWVCVPTRPECPAAGTPCDGSVAVCSPWCFGTGVECVDGTWVEHYFEPPP